MSIDGLLDSVTCSSVHPVPVRVSNVAVKSLSSPMSKTHGQVLNRAHTLERSTHVTSGAQTAVLLHRHTVTGMYSADFCLDKLPLNSLDAPRGSGAVPMANGNASFVFAIEIRMLLKFGPD